MSFNAAAIVCLFFVRRRKTEISQREKERKRKKKERKKRKEKERKGKKRKEKKERFFDFSLPFFDV